MGQGWKALYDKVNFKLMRKLNILEEKVKSLKKKFHDRKRIHDISNQFGKKENSYLQINQSEDRELHIFTKGLSMNLQH